MFVPNLRSRSSFARSFACAVLALSSTLAYAISPEQVMDKARLVSQRVNAQAMRMSGNQLSSLNSQLSRILADLGPGMPGPGGPGPGPGGPGPHPGPGGPGGPIPRAECKLLGRGSHAGWTYAYRLALNGQSMEGSDQLDAILDKIDQYRRDGICGVVGLDLLTLGARGSYAGWTYAFRVMLNGEAIAGSDDLEAMLATIAKLDSARVARTAGPIAACQLLPRGSYAGWTYNYRVGVGADVMSGSDSYAAITATIQRLRQARVCY